MQCKQYQGFLFIFIKIISESGCIFNFLSISSITGSWVGLNGSDQPHLGPSLTPPSGDSPALYEPMLLLWRTLLQFRKLTFGAEFCHIKRDVKGNIISLREWWAQLHVGVLYQVALANSLFRGLVWRAFLFLRDSQQKIAGFTIHVFV